MLPKYYPGQIVKADSDWVFAIETAHFNEGWCYGNPSTGRLVEEDDITHVLNGGFWLPVTAYNPPVEATRPIDTSLFDAMMEDDPDEQLWLKENIQGKEDELRYVNKQFIDEEFESAKKKIEVTDGKEEL